MIVRRAFTFVQNAVDRIVRDEQGASATELAIFAPFLAAAIMGITDLSMSYSRKLEIEGAAARSLEKVSVGIVSTDYSLLRNEAAAAAGVPLANVALDNWLECNRVRQTSFTGTCPTGEEIGRYVKITINASYTPQFSYGPLVTTNGVVPLQAVSAVRVQ